MADEQKKPEKFSEVNDPRARTRDKSGKWSGLGALAESPEVKVVSSAIKTRDYRKFLESIEPGAMQVLARAMRSKGVPIKERIAIATDILNRLHGKALVSVEADAAKKKIEQMSTDELRDLVKKLLAETGLEEADVVEASPGQVVN